MQCQLLSSGCRSMLGARVGCSLTVLTVTSGTALVADLSPPPPPLPLFSLLPSTGTAKCKSIRAWIDLSFSLCKSVFFFFFEPLECALVPALEPTALASDGNQTRLSI
ncbi:hypothetical protein SORBI_3009G152140 [Sorghum bicolor]|uniref:Uncharacterized protein n=1 Tax=Sorghum bicolor TaxID=4558 RepID=A0A1Z5R2V3_SORBI|nr:hypothetical protein SORBI_3009G152140 [Sorghum bicolor]